MIYLVTKSDLRLIMERSKVIERNQEKLTQTDQKSISILNVTRTELMKNELDIKHDSANILGNMDCGQSNLGSKWKGRGCNEANFAIDDNKCSFKSGF